MNTLCSSISCGVKRYSIVSSSVRIWKPSTSASVHRMILLQRSALMSNDAMDLFAFDFTCTPQPSTLMRSVMISLLKILS